MKPSLTQIGLGAVLVVGTLLLAVSGSPAVPPPAAAVAPDRDREFHLSLARIDAQLQTLRRLRKEIHRHPADSAKGGALRQKWAEGQRHIDELLTKARQAARSDAQHLRVKQLATLAQASR